MIRMPTRLCLHLPALAICLGASAAVAQEPVETFYRGKTVTITVGSAVGGGFDTYARLVGRHLGRHVPGGPSVVVQNIPGAGSNRAATYVAMQAPRDGTSIGAVQPTALVWPLISDQPMPHDASKFILLGSVNRSVFLCLARTDAGFTTFKETFEREILIGGSTEGATLRDYPLLLINELGVKFRLVAGYPGSREIMLAMERNEVHGMCGMDWSSLVTQRRDWITSGFVRLLGQEDLEGHPEMNRMGVPLTITFARTPQERQVLEMIYSQNLFGRPYMLGPGVPAERVAALRAALAAVLKDKDFLREAESSGLDINPMGGEELQQLIARLYALPPDIVQRAKRSMTTQRAGR